MALIPFTGFVGGSYLLRSVNSDCQRSLNLFPEVNEIGTQKNQEIGALVQAPGLAYRGTFGNGPHRGSYQASNGNAYFVSGNQLYRITDTVTFSASVVSGSFSTSTGRVSITDNGITLLIVDGLKGYTSTLSPVGVITEIADADFPNGATECTFLDGYFIVNKADTAKFYISALYDGTSWDALDFSSKEGRQDRLVAIVADHRELWLLGAQTTEIWFNSANADFPLERIPGGFIEYGVVAAGTVKKLTNTGLWLSQDEFGRGMVVKVIGGYQPQRVSTITVEQAIAGYGDISTSTAWTYQKDGHSFYCLNCPSAPVTWVYDLSTGLWHERDFTNINGGSSRHRAETHVFVGGKHYVGDYEDGLIYELSDTTYLNMRASSGSDHPMTRMRRYPHFSELGRRTTHNMLQLDCETGVGLEVASTTLGYNPQVMLRWSDNGGHSWSNEHWVSLGQLGQYLSRAIWRRLGMSRDRVYEITVTDPVRVSFTSTFLDTASASN